MNNALIHSKNTKLGKLQTPTAKNRENRPFLLDTLAQDDQMLKFGGDEGLLKLKKRSLSKFYANEIIYPLIDLKNEREKAYWNTFHCVNVLKQDENGKVTSRYCKNRWCIVCNKIRTGLLINKYLPEIAEWKNPHFVTLTTGLTKTCKDAPQLTQVVKTYGTTFYKVWRRLKRNFGQIRAIRKLEITYNETENHYHPHFHLIIDAEKGICNDLVRMWVSSFNEAEIWSQDVRQADENSVRELFKYFTKMWKRIEGEETENEKRISPYHPETMDTIFSVMQGKQVFKAYGKKLKIDDDFTPDKANVYLNEQRFEETFWLWEQDQKTWINILTGEFRT
jgi:plasmid rolling circle replication initiator protein Rep